MDWDAVPESLRERLGPEATGGLVDLLGIAQREWSAEVIEASVDRFERRLGAEIGGVRQDMTTEFAAVRREMTEGFAKLRQEMTEGFAQVRREMTEGLAQVRQEMTQGLADVRREMTAEFAAVRREMADMRFDLLKWSFVFWIGQVLAIAGIMSLMLRTR
jgi:hypothetical protein